jgi:hypothetical protein
MPFSAATGVAEAALAAETVLSDQTQTAAIDQNGLPIIMVLPCLRVIMEWPKKMAAHALDGQCRIAGRKLDSIPLTSPC